MKRTHIAICIVGIAITLAAEPVCRVVQTAVHKHYSRKTLDSWATWRQSHPDWVPKTKKETLAELDFACAPIATLDAETTDLIAPSEEPISLVFAMEQEDVVLSPTEQIFVPTETAASTSYPMAGYPYQSPYLYFTGYPSLPPKRCKKCRVPPPAIVPVPEPWPIGLVMLGASCLYFKKHGTEHIKQDVGRGKWIPVCKECEQERQQKMIALFGEPVSFGGLRK